LAWDGEYLWIAGENRDGPAGVRRMLFAEPGGSPHRLPRLQSVDANVPAHVLVAGQQADGATVIAYVDFSARLHRIIERKDGTADAEVLATWKAGTVPVALVLGGANQIYVAVRASRGEFGVIEIFGGS
jgi:hypothetical protein